jgi:hypothetical protein
MMALPRPPDVEASSFSCYFECALLEVSPFSVLAHLGVGGLAGRRPNVGPPQGPPRREGMEANSKWPVLPHPPMMVRPGATWHSTPQWLS